MAQHVISVRHMGPTGRNTVIEFPVRFVDSQQHEDGLGPIRWLVLCFACEVVIGLAVALVWRL